MSNSIITSPQNLAELSDTDLMKLEFEIARKYSQGFPWLMIVWPIANVTCWLSLWPLTLSGVISLWISFPIATLNVLLVFLPIHDALHGIIARPKQKLRWLNELVGHATSWVLVLPFELLRIVHKQHHLHANDPELDPDYPLSQITSPWQAMLATFSQRLPSSQRMKNYIKIIVDAGRTDLLKLGGLYQLGFYSILFILFWQGYGLHAFLLWWLPIQIALGHNIFFFGWVPHRPALKTGRYRDTRSWKSKVGNLGSAGMQYHIVHHLHPQIPLHRTPAAYRELEPILKARGCDIP